MYRLFAVIPYILAIRGENVVARGFLCSDGGFWPFWGENVLAGGRLVSAGRIWPFWAKRYHLGVFMPRRYILAILDEKVPAGVFSRVGRLLGLGTRLPPPPPGPLSYQGSMATSHT